MKRILMISFGCLVVIFSLALFAQSFWGGKTMSKSQVKAKWGSEKYDPKKFRDGNYEIKSKMAYSMMTDKSLIGKPYVDIIEMFGPPEGFYFIDTYPAYIIQKGKNRTEDTWQIVFKIGDGYKVRDIIVHRNCCER